jgi:hypothetical protein
MSAAPRRFVSIFHAILALLAWTAGAPLWAQAPAPGQLPPAPALDPLATRSLSFEWVIVAVMIGLAVFVVCKSSRRN